MFYLKVDFAKKLNCKYSIFAQFTYNSNYVNICKSMPIRAFDFDTKITKDLELEAKWIKNTL